MLTLLLAILAVVPPAEQISTIELRTGELIQAVGPIERQGSRIVFRVGTRAFSVKTDEVVSISQGVPAPTTPTPPPPDTIHVSRQPRTPVPLRVDRSTAEKILNSIEAAPEDSPAARSAALPADVSHPPPSPDAPDPRDEHYWRERWRDAKDRVTYAREELELLRQREQRLNDEILGLLSLGFDQSQMARQAWQLQNTRDQMERAALEIERAERDLTRVLNDARREGIYPSWLRE